jgi:cobalt-zinc-cadmium efflux system membrane fusion protein
VPRAESIGQVNPNMPMSDTAAGMLQELQLQSQALTRQLDLIKSALAQRIEIKAPVSGLVTAANVSAGQIVASRDTLFELVDRNKLLVEGYSFDSAAAGDIAAATATTDDRRQLKLAFLGRGSVLQQQAVLLRFRVTEGAARLDIGTPVRILVTGGTQTSGIKLPRTAVQRESGALVWVQSGPETFVPRTVTVVPLDADQVLVTGGIAADARLVAAGAQFISQVR